MRLLPIRSTAVLFVASSALFVGLTAEPAAAHKHPTPIQLDSPAVVRVETYGQVSISLIEHNNGVHIGLLQKTYDTPPLASGTGFAVDPSGAVVTSPAAIDADLRRAEIYAVNQIFHERYGDRAPLPADPFSRQWIRDDGSVSRISGRLQRCYKPNTADDTGGCVVFSSRVVKVLPFVSSQTRYGDLVADVIVPKAAGTGDVAVLKVGASSMPTVQLADSTQGAVAFSLLGFSGVPSDGRSLRKVDGHFVSSGAAAVKKDEHFTELTAAMTAGLSGGPVVAERGQVVGFLNQSAGDAQQSGPGALTLIGPGPIRAALTKAGINPHRGPADFAYESALHNYGNKLYAPAVPSLAQTMKLYPGHVLAGEALADATAKSGTAEDAARQLPSESAAHNGLTSRSRGLIAAGIAAAVLIGILAIVFLLRGRRGPREEAAPRDQSESPAAAPPDPRGTGPGPQTARREETVVTSRAPSGAGTQRGFVSNAALVPAARTPQSSGSSARPETSMVCGRCGEIVSRAHEFCEYCGQRLR